MAGLEGTVKVPIFGEVPKKTALLVGGGIAVLVGIMYYRGKKASAAAASVAAAGSSEINPATGFAYGSPEDAAAMAAQAAYVTPGGVGTGGGGGSPGQPTGFTSNGQWAQAAEQYMQAEGLIVEPTALASALGKYITGHQATPLDSDLIHQAIAFQGYPPISGPNGYPPAINTSTDPVPTPDPTPTPTALSAPTGVRIDSGAWTDRIAVYWNAVPGAVSYVIRGAEANRDTPGPVTGMMVEGLKHNGSYFVSVAAKNAAGQIGAFSPNVPAKTKN